MCLAGGLARDAIVIAYVHHVNITNIRAVVHLELAGPNTVQMELGVCVQQAQFPEIAGDVNTFEHGMKKC